MPDYCIIGAEESPYSVKVRSYFRYKQLPHQWLSRAEASDLYRQHAKLPLIPLVITPQDTAMQDSTPIIETVEAAHPEPTIYPADPVSRFVSELLEEFGDEWGNKWMFHYRWAREVDQIACSRRLAQAMAPDANDAALDEAASTIRSRMVDRVWFVGSSAQTAPQIESSFKDFLELLEAHLANREFLFGSRPSFADFGLWGQLYNCNRDPTPHQIMELRAPRTLAWVDRMLDPPNTGEYESWGDLKPSLQPILADQVGRLFLPWSAANQNAIEAGGAEFSVPLTNGTWTQRPQKYHARSLHALRDKYALTQPNPELNALLEDTDCLRWLATDQ
jgi:glutathione S-transferase